MTNAIDRRGSAVVTLPSDREIVITRQFDAPADLIFKAYTTPELVKRWWGFETSEWLVCDIDLRVGGTWRYVTREAEGYEVAFHGEFRELAPPHRLVSTEVFEGLAELMPGVDPEEAAALDTVVFDERDGITTVTITVLHQTQEHRDGHIASGMEEGMQVSLDRLEVAANSLR